MRKITSIICVLLLLLSLAACSSSESAESAQQEQNTPVAEAPEEATNNAEEDEPEETEAAMETVPFEEIVAVDNEYCSVKITGIDGDSMWGYTLKVLLENKSADQTFMFSVESAAINGVMADPLFAAEVAAGKKSNEEIIFATDTLADNGIGEFTDLELNFRVYDNEDWMAEPVAEITSHVYPYGEENAVPFVREAQPEDTILVDNDYATVILTGCGEDDIWGYNAYLYIVNKSDTTIMVSADEASINGFMIDPMYADTVNSGKCAFSSITWFGTDLEDNGITEVENMEFTLRIYDNEDWMADDYYNEIVTITP